MLERLGIQPARAEQGRFFHGAGCEQCFHTGYRGRSGLYELLVVDDAIRRHIMKGADTIEIRRLAQEKGLVLLREDGIAKALDGTTTLEEVLRVTQG